MKLTHYSLIVALIAAAVRGSIRRYYATNSCGHVRGPDHLVVLEYDKSVDYDDKKPWEEQGILPPQDIRGTLWECIIVVRGMPAANSKKYLGIHWRSFYIRDPDVNSVQNSVETCGKAYVTIYEGKDTTAKNSYTLCGKDATRSHFEWLGDYVTFYFYADFRHYTNQTPPTTTPSCTDPTKVKVNDNLI
ncbi:hypothetical protein CHS0354_042935 [Potamilus streckersoni]|uniref:Uncharacterized protein n=1 Tax=Potamilus streckersoni TaxID=2493646 RepID=A0AAE0T5E8_9BIVA|nr:hypothetical protein CHS0354_042935 [Potamilus streckersoni]